MTTQQKGKIYQMVEQEAELYGKNFDDSEGEDEISGIKFDLLFDLLPKIQELENVIKPPTHGDELPQPPNK